MPRSDGPAPAIRPIEDRDVNAVITLWHAAGVARPWNDPAWDIEFVRRGAHATVLVAEDDGSIVATAMVGEDGHRGWIYYVATLPERQRTGIGRAIMGEAERCLAARGVWKVNLMVRGDNAAVRSFYERLGYRDTQTVCLQKVIAAPAGT
jgi:ribosomal protein S18 acetylase RimI-like enzyme